MGTVDRHVAVVLGLLVLAGLGGCSLLDGTATETPELPEGDTVERRVTALEGMRATINTTTAAGEKFRTRVVHDFTTGRYRQDIRLVGTPGTQVLVVRDGLAVSAGDRMDTAFVDSAENTSERTHADAVAIFEALANDRDTVEGPIMPGVAVPAMPAPGGDRGGAPVDREWIHEVTYLGRDSVEGRTAHAVRLTPRAERYHNYTVWYDSEWYVPTKVYVNYTHDRTGRTEQVWSTWTNVSFNPAIAAGTFDIELDAGQDVDYAARVDGLSRATLAAITTDSLVDPRLGGFTFVEGVVGHTEGSRTDWYAQVYADGGRQVTVTVYDGIVTTDLDGTERVSLGNTTGYLRTGETRTLVWQCSLREFRVEGSVSTATLVEAAEAVGCPVDS